MAPKRPQNPKLLEAFAQIRGSILIEWRLAREVPPKMAPTWLRQSAKIKVQSSQNGVWFGPRCPRRCTQYGPEMPNWRRRSPKFEVQSSLDGVWPETFPRKWPQHGSKMPNCPGPLPKIKFTKRRLAPDIPKMGPLWRQNAESPEACAPQKAPSCPQNAKLLGKFAQNRGPVFEKRRLARVIPPKWRPHGPQHAKLPEPLPPHRGPRVQQAVWPDPPPQQKQKKTQLGPNGLPVGSNRIRGFVRA